MLENMVIVFKLLFWGLTVSYFNLKVYVMYMYYPRNSFCQQYIKRLVKQLDQLPQSMTVSSWRDLQ